MTLNALWFILIGVLFTGFFLLEGFDYGVGILLPFLGKKDEERRVIINTIGPVWDANEVWLITAGGAMFAAFPDVVRHPLQRLLPGAAADAGRPDRARCGVRVSQQGQEPALARALGLVHFRWQPGSGAPVGRRAGEHCARGADQCRYAVCRRLFQPVEPVCLAGWPGCGRGDDAARRHLPQPAHHG